MKSIQASEESQKGAISFSAEARLPENQINKNVTYFDLQMSPNQEEKIYVHLTNTSSQEVKIKPAINRARTNPIGVIEYNKKSEKLSSNAQANIEDIAKIDAKEIKLAANEQYDLEIKIKMPSKKLEGVQAGAIYLLQESKDDTKGNIKNQYAREIGLILQSSDPKKIDSELSFTKVTAGQMNYRNSILLDLDNSKPKFMKLKDISATIKKKGNDKVLHEVKQPNMTIAPNTKFTFPISLNSDEYKSGKYIVTFSANEGEKKWNLSKELTIDSKEGKELNNKDVLVQNKPSFWQQNKWMILIIALLVIVIISLLIVNKKNKNG